MCLKTINSSETQLCDLSNDLKDCIITNSKKISNFPIENSKKLCESDEIDSWEQLLDKPEEHYEKFPLKQVLSKDEFSKEKESSQISLNLGIQQTLKTNILEISNMLPNISAKEIYETFDTEKDHMKIKWINHTKAQLCFSSEEAAINAYFKYLSSSFSIGNLSPLPSDYYSIHSSISSAFTSCAKTPFTVFHKNTFLETLEPLKYSVSDKRPAKTSTVAKRLITSVLGIRALRTAKEKEYDEIMIHQFLNTLKEKKEQERLKEDIWEKEF
ncbi:hypothetical protein PCANB_000528 [Pneumocystis canis]|nr:hypothetical protein PCK1_000632 [Pneumocystis canis]KAG5437814.1 hypothetical protein PCANB_000528 [Pneumocystis canis]